MKIGIYTIISNPLPQLEIIKNIEVNKEDFNNDDSIVRIMNKYTKMDKLYSEHIYALGLSFSLMPKGIIFVSKGTCSDCEVDMRGLATGLLLIGAEQFIAFHNHPGGNKEISKSDILLTQKYSELGNLIGIDLCNHIMITQNYYNYCNETETETEFIPFS